VSLVNNSFKAQRSGYIRYTLGPIDERDVRKMAGVVMLLSYIELFVGCCITNDIDNGVVMYEM